MSDQVISARTLVSLGQFGERARPVRAQMNEAALIIGLGYVGLKATAQAHEMLGRMLRGHEFQNNVRLLAIYRRWSYKQEEQIMSREERLSLEMKPIDWDAVPGHYSARGVAQWWPPSPRATEIREDPWRTRAYNRLLLFDKAELVSEKLFTLARWLQNVGTGRDLQMKRRIYVLASLAEAEGSGMVFDIVSRLRDLMSQHPTTITGIFSLRDRTAAQSDRTAAMANVYATLCEIDSYTLHPDSFPSTLPLVGHSLTRSRGKPALDMILLADDADATGLDLPDPEALLAEAVTGWMAASLGDAEHPPDLPQPIPVEPGADRFRGYSMFGVGKLALPTRAAMHWAAVRLGHSVLKAAMITHPNVPTTTWVESLLSEARSAALSLDLLHMPDVTERLRGWEYDLSSAGLIRNLEARTDRGDSDRMRELAQAEWRRLEREFGDESTIGQSAVIAMLDSLRLRMDRALSDALQPLVHRLTAGAVDLAYGRGLGLIWTVSAFEALETRVRALLPEIQELLDAKKTAYKMAGDAFIKSAQEYDERIGGRRGRTSPLPDLDERAGVFLRAALDLMENQAKLNIWQELSGLIGDLTNQVRVAIAEVNKVAQSLEEYRVAAGEALRIASEQVTPSFPAAVVANRHWFLSGTRNLDAIGQTPPHELLIRVFKAWGRPNHITPERQLVEFLRDIRTAARRALAGDFRFPDVYQFLVQNWETPIVSKAIAQLPDAAMPVLHPDIDEHHPPPAWYEIVRQIPRTISALGPALNSVTRASVPSPDPDEIMMMCILHGVMAEALPKVRGTYRRSYQRAEAEGVPLHIDRQWDRTMADLVHTTTRHEISLIWENVLGALHGNIHEADRPLNDLIQALGRALDVTGTTAVANLPPDMRLVMYKLPLFQLRLPPPTCAVLFLFSNRPASRLSEEISLAIASLPLQEPFAFVVDVNNRPDVADIIRPLTEGGYNVLVLSEADVKQVIGARQPTRALNDLVISRVKLVTVSPFYTRDPVPEHMFFGRDHEIADVRRLLRSHSVVLIGGRRIGKTSTLFRIRHHLETPESDYVPYYLDCHGAVDYESLFSLVKSVWEIEIVEDSKPIYFREVVTGLQQRHKGKKLVFLFDEVDSLLRFDRSAPNQETLFRTFRSLSHEKRCQFVFSGEKWLMRSLEDPYSALFNFAKPVQLKPLPSNVVEDLIAKPFQMLNIWMEDSPRVVDRIFRVSAGHPNVVQMICEGMVLALDQDPESANLLRYDHLSRTLDQPNLQYDIVRTIWGQMDPLAKLVTLYWPPGEEFITLDGIRAILRQAGIEDVPPDLLKWTARDLEVNCFLRPVQNGRWKLLPTLFEDLLKGAILNQEVEIDQLRLEIDQLHDEYDYERTAYIRDAQYLPLTSFQNIKLSLMGTKGFLIGQESALKIRCENRASTGIRFSFELDSTSQYTVRPDNASDTTLGQTPLWLRPSETKDFDFLITVHDTGKHSLQIKIDGKPFRPALEILCAPDNFYTYGNPIEDKADFFGREDELKRIRSNIVNPTGSHTMIVGEQRTGKSSLLAIIKGELQLPYIPVKIGFEGIPHSDEKAAAAWLLHEIVESLKEQEHLDDYAFDLKYGSDLPRHLAKIIQQIKNKVAKVRLILLFDEGHLVEQVGLSFQEILRKTFSNLAQDIRVVFACYFNFAENTHAASSPLQNIFNYIILQPLDDASLTKLIEKRAESFNYTFTKEAGRAIRDLSGGQPYYCQALCKESLDRAQKANLREITITHVEAAKSQLILALRSNFKSGYWDPMSPEEKRFLEVVINCEPGFQPDPDVLRRLEQKAVLTVRNGVYCIQSKMFEIWLRELISHHQ